MTNELQKLVANSPEGVTAVGSGVLLGCLFVTLIILIRMLWMLYQDEREINEDRRFRNECRREILKVACVLLQSQGGNLCKLAQTDEKRAHLDHDDAVVFGVRPTVNRQLGHVLNPVSRFLSKLFFGVHKSKNAAKQPNAPKLSHGHGKSAATPNNSKI